MMAYEASVPNSTPECQLFDDLKYEFPNLSAEIIENCMKECSYRYPQCKELLCVVKDVGLGQSSSTRKNSSTENYAQNESSRAQISPNINSPTSSSYDGNIGREKIQPRLVENTEPVTIVKGAEHHDHLQTVSDFPITNVTSVSNNQACSTFVVRNSPSLIHSNMYSLNRYGNKNLNDSTDHNNIAVDSPMQLNANTRQSPYQPLRTSFSENNLSSRARVTSPSIVRCDMQVRYNNSTPTSPSSNQGTRRPNPTVPRHVTRLYFDTQPVHLTAFNQARPTYQHSTSINYAITPTARQSVAVPHYQPLHVITETTGGGVTAISTNVRQSNQHDYLSNTLLASPRLGFQHGFHKSPMPPFYRPNMHGHGHGVINRTTSPRLQSNSQDSRSTPVYQFPPDVSLRQDDHSFKQALIQRQKSRLEHLRCKLVARQRQLDDIRNEVNALEDQLLQKQVLDNMFSKSQLQELPLLRQENRDLKIKCQCISWEIDMLSNNKNEDFFSQLNTGPSMPNATKNEHRKSAASKALEGINTEPRNSEADEAKQWHCTKCTFLNDHLMDRCEMCQMIRIPDIGDVDATSQHFLASYSSTAMLHAPDTRQRLQDVHIQLSRNSYNTNNVRLNIELTRPRR